MPIVAMLGFVGNLFSILVLNSPGVDMKVNTLLVVVLIILIIVLHSSRVDAPLTEGQSSWGVWTRIQMTLWRFEILLEFRAVHKYVIFASVLFISLALIFTSTCFPQLCPQPLIGPTHHTEVWTQRNVCTKNFSATYVLVIWSQLGLIDHTSLSPPCMQLWTETFIFQSVW